MTQLSLLGANKTIDTNKQSVEVNQVVKMEGYSYDRYVVHAIVKNDWGIHYKLINLRTKDFQIADTIRPLKEKFGIGFYYDSEKPEFMDAFEVAILIQEVQQKKQQEEDTAEQERTRVEEVKKIGRVRFTEILPENAQAVIVARLKQNDSDTMTDYYAHSTQRTVIVGFSKHKRDLFSEMRKHASNFEETTYLVEFNEDYEHREKYSMGDGYYLGESKYCGWIIEKVSIYDRNRTIEEFAYIAGNEDNIHISATSAVETTIKDCVIVEYSQKALAVFGDTKTIKDILKSMGGRFNPKLTYNGEKKAGWIFPNIKKKELNKLINSK